jgi:hypothetical protein
VEEFKYLDLDGPATRLDGSEKANCGRKQSQVLQAFAATVFHKIFSGQQRLSAREDSIEDSFLLLNVLSQILFIRTLKNNTHNHN